MGRISDFVMGVCVLVVPMSRSNDCDMSKAVYKKAIQHYVINCMSKNLTALPREIDSSVTQLLLSYNMIEYLEPDCFDLSRDIRLLYLNFNPLKTLPEEVFIKLDMLWTLNLDHNEIENLPTDVFNNAGNIHYLELNDNLLTSLPLGMFDRLLALSELKLAGNPFTVLSADFFKLVPHGMTIYLDWSIVCPNITEWWALFNQEIFGVPLIMLVEEGSEYYMDEAYPCWGITQSQLQTTKHDMNSPVRQHQVTTITASKMISTEHQNGQEGKTATAEGMAYTTCVGILGVAASVFPIVYIGIKLVGNQLGTGMAGQAAQATQNNIKNDRSGDFASEQMKIDITNFFELTTEKQSFHGWINIPPVDYKDSIQ